MGYIETKKLVSNILETVKIDLTEKLLMSENEVMKLYEKWKNLANEYFNEELHTGFFDGSAKPNPGRLKLGGYITNSNNEVVHEFSSRDGEGTNNEAEYKAFIRLIKDAKRLGIKNIVIYGDSLLVVNQIKGEWKCKQSNIQELFSEAMDIINYFDKFEINHVLRNSNKKADKLTR